MKIALYDGRGVSKFPTPIPCENFEVDDNNVCTCYDKDNNTVALWIMAVGEFFVVSHNN